MVDSLLTRRELLERLKRIAAIPSTAVFLSAWLQAAPQHAGHGSDAAPPQPDLLRDYKPEFFVRDDFEALQSFTEILIPTDDDPGAREVHCAHFIDFVLNASSDTPQTQQTWRKAMAALKAAGFHEANPTRRVELVTEMSHPEMEPNSSHPAYFAYRLIKQQTAFAFYTSRSGMIDVLNYKGNSYNLTFPGCTHPEHQSV